jgi:hypothetical protein
MGVLDAIWEGEVPSLDDVSESASTVADVAWHASNPGAALAVDAAEYMHYEVRDELNHVGDPSMYPSTDDLPTTESQRNDAGWTRLPHGQSILHQDETVPGDEAKFVHEDGRESVRYVGDDGSYGDEVTRDDIRGTYNYINPGNWEEDGVAEYSARMAGHFMADVVPWAIGGSVRGPG